VAAHAQPIEAAPTRSWAARAASTPWTWIAIIGFMFAWPLVRSIQAASHLPPQRPHLGEVPAFGLVDQRLEPLGAAELRGRVWIASFTYASCDAICPDMVETMSRVQHRVRGLGQSIKLVTFSVQPRRDTPERFADYAAKHRASPRIWGFATGAPDQVGLVMEAFDVTAAPQTRFFLVDRDMQIRGTYDMTDAASEDLLVRDAGLLVNRGS
jgi:protein SCO1/2